MLMDIGKVRFATALLSPQVAGSVLFFAKDLYLLVLGADVRTMAYVATALSVWGPACFPLSGYLMDKGLLERWFPRGRWGRRAPWYLPEKSIGFEATLGSCSPIAKSARRRLG